MTKVEDVKKRKRIVKGKHDVYCYMCGRNYAIVIHYSSNKKLIKCKDCQDSPHVCIDCWQERRP